MSFLCASFGRLLSSFSGLLKKQFKTNLTALELNSYVVIL